MTRTSPRTNFHSSELIRCLSDLSLAEAADHGTAFAEKLGQWIHFADAITLSAVHGEGVAVSPGQARPPSGAHGAACNAAVAEFDRIQGFLVNSITKSCSPDPASPAKKTHISLPLPEPEPPQSIAAAYAPYRRFYEAHHRDMESSIQPLRVNLRGAVAKASPRLRKLAELDALFEKILRERETKLLSKVPLLLKARFEQLFKEHQQTLADTGQADDPAGWIQPDARLARFCSDMQMLLLAEMELRLQPAMGLIEAFRQDTQ